MGKRGLFLCVVLAVVLTVAGADVLVSTSFREPATDGLRFIYSRDGLRWDSIEGVFLCPEVGAQRVMRDPSIVRGPDGTFHLVWTSSWRGDRGFGYASSKDLIHWSAQRFIATGMDSTTVNTWAPELFYDDVRRQFLIVWASCVPGRFPDFAEDHLNNHRLYYMTTRDFRTFSAARLFYDPGFSAIDATLLKRGAKDYVMVVKDNSRPMRNLKVAFASSPYGPWSAASAPFTESFTEGPSTARVGDWWYIYYDSYSHGIYGAHRTRDFKNFQDQTGTVSFPVGHKHGTVFMADEQLVQGLVKYNRDVVHYSGTTVARPARHDGALKPVVGVHNIQTMRGERPWTYNHQPMLCHWQGRFYLHYLSDPRHEHEAPGKTLMQTSADGYEWTPPVELFPEYDVPEGWTKPGSGLPPAHGLKAVMHQRVGWYVAPGGQLLATGSYGICLTLRDDPNDGNGIGRVVREVKPDGTLGPIYFVYYNHGFGPHNTDFPHYKKSRDKALVRAVDAMLADPMQRMQWVEEADRDDPLIPLSKPYKAFCGYTLPDGRKVALWKHAVTSLSADGGHTWRQVPLPGTGKTGCDRAPGFVNSNAKIWGQRLTDGTYATVYNPAEYRWPLAISLSADGLDYTTLSLLTGDLTPLRHGGQYKSYGPQYVRGIQEGNGTPPDSSLWVTYSNNKEDIWVARVPVPVALQSTTHADGDFTKYGSLSDMTDWNLRMPRLCPIKLDGPWLSLYDADPYDYATAERVVPNTKDLEVAFDLRVGQVMGAGFCVDFLDDEGSVCSSIVADSTGSLRVKGGARYGTLLRRCVADSVYHLRVRLSTSLHRAVYYLNGQKACERQFDTPVASISRVVFRTGPLFDEPNYHTPADQDFDQPRADERDETARFQVGAVLTRSLDGDATAVLHYDDFAHYAERFNAADDEYTATTIPNAEASEWMRRNIPLFDCPQEDFREIYYFRWWTLRKHLRRTPVGFGMTEFLVPRSYADRYNLIACAVGHHVMETRWLRDTTYLHQVLRTWYYGNDGQAMTKMNKFSSWNPWAVVSAWQVLGDTTFVLGLRPRLEEEFARWRRTNRLPSGLYWQGDVQDGMEESISGGRRKQYARPTINSYMCGNAYALAFLNTLAGQTAASDAYRAEGDTLKTLLHNRLWNDDHHFFETLRGDTSACVREAIGFLPWYFGLPPQGGKYDEAWRQLTDDEGFQAPYGLTTAERRHPEFRSHGVGKCEWDGAIWPFATSQTLTALANYLNDYAEPVLSDSVFFCQMLRYAESQHHRGRPYIGEYLDEKTGAWLMGDRERSRYYNHSTFGDLVITGLAGLRPQTDGRIVVNPLVPAGRWPWFCLDGVRYRGHLLTILWDQDGQRYHQGKGLTLLVDGRRVAHRKDLGKLTY